MPFSKKRAESIFVLVTEVHDELAARKGLQTGEIHIGTSDTLCLYLLPPVVQAFCSAYPGIEIHLTNRMSHEVVALLKEGRIDFGLITLPVNELHVAQQHRYWQEDVAIFNPEHPLAGKTILALEDLAGETLLLLEQGSASRALLDRSFAAAQLSPPVIELGSIEVIKRYVEIGLGISIVPAMAVETEVTAGRLATATLPWLERRSVGTVLRAKGHLSRAGEAFLQCLTEYLGH